MNNVQGFLIFICAFFGLGISFVSLLGIAYLAEAVDELRDALLEDDYAANE